MASLPPKRTVTASWLNRASKCYSYRGWTVASSCMLLEDYTIAPPTFFEREKDYYASNRGFYVYFYYRDIVLVLRNTYWNPNLVKNAIIFTNWMGQKEERREKKKAFPAHLKIKKKCFTCFTRIYAFLLSCLFTVFFYFLLKKPTNFLSKL